MNADRFYFSKTSSYGRYGVWGWIWIKIWGPSRLSQTTPILPPPPFWCYWCYKTQLTYSRVNSIPKHLDLDFVWEKTCLHAETFYNFPSPTENNSPLQKTKTKRRGDETWVQQARFTSQALLCSAKFQACFSCSRKGQVALSSLFWHLLLTQEVYCVHFAEWVGNPLLSWRGRRCSVYIHTGTLLASLVQMIATQSTSLFSPSDLVADDSWESKYCTVIGAWRAGWDGRAGTIN